MKPWNLHQKRILITGATKGIGLAAAEEMAQLGAELMIVARTAGDVDQQLKRLGQWSPVYGLAADLSQKAEREKVIAAVREQWPALDVLVNNVGFNIRKSVTEYDSEEVEQILDTNLRSAFELTRGLYPQLREGNYPVVINVASVAGLVDVRSGAPYGMTKAAMLQMTRHLAAEWGAEGIRVNAVSPWYTRTPLTDPVLSQPDRLRGIEAATPLGRVAEAEEVAAAIAFLAMDKASYITGQNVVVDGGMMVKGL